MKCSSWYKEPNSLGVNVIKDLTLKLQLLLLLQMNLRFNFIGFTIFTLNLQVDVNGESNTANIKHSLNK